MNPDPAHNRDEAELSADLEEIWQDESETTAANTEFADEVDGQFGTRDQL